MLIVSTGGGPMNKSEAKILLNYQRFAVFRYMDLHFGA